MHATITMHEEDDPRASVIEDSNGIPFLVIGSPGSLGGLTVELTADLMADIAGIVKGWHEEAEGRDHDQFDEAIRREAQQLNPRSIESEWEEFEYHRHLR